MNMRHHWIFGLAGLGLVMAAPVQARPDHMQDMIVVTKNDRSEEARPQSRDDRKADRRASRQRSEREEAQGYGYGYERRQRERSEEDDRSRSRR